MAMSFTEQIKQDMYTAMKSGDKIRTNILRTLLSSLKEKEIEKKDSLNDIKNLLMYIRKLEDQN